jgi:hypothetical protein
VLPFIAEGDLYPSARTSLVSVIVLLALLVLLVLVAIG